MNSFIPEEDMPAFEKFLSDHNLHPKALSSPPAAPLPPTGAPPPPPPPNKVQHEGTTDIDSFLTDFQKDAENILTTNF